MFKFTMKATLVGLGLFAASANAALINTAGQAVADVNTTYELVYNLNDQGRITEVYNIDVGGDLFNVFFKNATFNEIILDLDADSQEQATQFSQALIDQVLVDRSFGAFDADMSLVEGCQDFVSVGRCGLFTAYFAGEKSYEWSPDYTFYQIDGMAARNTNSDQDQYGNKEVPSFNGYGESWLEKYIADNYSVWADWEPASAGTPSGTESGPVAVPTPPALSLFLAGLAGLVVARKRKNKA